MATPAQITIERLEQAMNLWEEAARFNLFQVAVLEQVCGQISRSKQSLEYALEVGKRFRESLLRANQEEFDPMTGGFTNDPIVNYELYLFGKFAESMYKWSRYSRNVYSLSDDMRVLLQATSFGTVRWHEIPWPFDSFAVILEKSVLIAPDMYSDTIIFSCDRNAHTNKIESISFCFVPVSVQEYECWDEKKFRRAFFDMGRKDVRVVQRVTTHLGMRAQKKAEFRYLRFNTEDLVDVPLKKLPQHAHGKEGESILEYSNAMLLLQMELARMVASVAFFLTTIPPCPSPQGDIRTRNWVPPAIKRNDPRLVSSGADICKLTFRHSLSPQEKDELEKCMAHERTGMVCPHWRRSHYRRAPGYGDDPLAPRNIFIPAVIVNRRHLPDGNLPGGAHVTLKSGKP